MLYQYILSNDSELWCEGPRGLLYETYIPSNLDRSNLRARGR